MYQYQVGPNYFCESIRNGRNDQIFVMEIDGCLSSSL